jgi:hypothetical protein
MSDTTKRVTTLALQEAKRGQVTLDWDSAP